MEGDRGSEPGPTGPDMRSGEARAAGRVEPRRRRRALAERSEDGHRHGGRGEGAEDPSRAHGAREVERRGAGRVPGRPPGGGAARSRSGA